MPKIFIQTELGTEKCCPMCHEYFPFDKEFYFKNGMKNGIQKWAARCKVCYMESYRTGYDI